MALVWLNGPGVRWIGPLVGRHLLEKSGIRGNFKVEGNLTGGLSISELRIEGDTTLASLSIDRVIPDYQWSGLVKGRLEGLTLDGVHADLRLGLKSMGKSPPLDLAQLVGTLRSIRGRVIPLALDFTNVSLAATRDGKPEVTLASSRISHSRGSNDIILKLGAITDESHREWPAQSTVIAWNPDNLSIPRVDPYPRVSIRELVMQLPAGGQPSVETQVHLDDAVFRVTSEPGFSAAKIVLREGKLQVDQAVKHFGIEIPAAATLTSLTVELEKILPDPTAAIAKVTVGLENIVWQDWTVPEVNAEASLSADQATLMANGNVLGSAFTLDAAAPVTRGKASFTLGDALGKFTIADVPKVLQELATRTPALDPVAPVPPSTLNGNFTLSFLANQLRAANADLLLKPQDDQLASPVTLKARWAPDQPISAALMLDGLTASASYQPMAATYQAALALDGFTSTRIDRWLAILKVKPGGVADLTGSWSGSGEVKSGKHRGELFLAQAKWSREMSPPLTAIGSLKYDWPASFETKDLRFKMNDQTLVLDAALANSMLELQHFLWTDGTLELAEGTANLPVPSDFSKWRDTLANDTRPLAVSINSRVLSLGLLKPWVPAFEKLDPLSTGQLELHVAGTYAVPAIDAKLEARDLRSPSQPQLPPADLKFTVSARDGHVVLDGSATAPDFPAAVLKAAMPFHPAEWAKTPELLKEEPLEARVDLPRLDLSRFSSLVPAAEQVSGIVTGNIRVAGKIGKPELKGTLDLTAAGLRFKGDRFPAVTGVAATVDLALDRIVLKNLKSTVAGGTLLGEGSLAITSGKLSDIDFRFRGSHLPLVRNDFLILRANADLRLQGPWERAALSGTVGAVDGIFYRDIELLPIGTPFTGPSAAALPKIDTPKNPGNNIPEPFRNWGLNVLARTEEPILIRGNFATGEVTGSIRIGGTLGTPAPDGTVKIKDVRASLPFSTLSVRAGTATFTPATGFDPILEIRGTAEPRPYQVTAYAYGRASDPQLVLTSNPPLPENEIMTLLATGTTTSGLEDPQAASSRALQLLLEELRRGRFRYGKQLRPVLALLDRVDFSLAEADPYSSESFSTATLSITDHWFLSAGVGATGDSRLLAVWRLTFH